MQGFLKYEPFYLIYQMMRFLLSVGEDSLSSSIIQAAKLKLFITNV